MTSLHDVTLRQLQYAVAVADTLGFHRAAARCHVSQPTLSAQVQQLETALGVRLFERTKRHVLVTSAGATLLDRARQVLLAAEDLLATAKHAQDPLAGTFRIGVIPTIAPYVLPEVMPALHAAYPKLQVLFREEKTADVVQAVHDGVLDAGLVALEADLAASETMALVTDPFVVALPLNHPLTRKKRLRLGDLEDLPVLLLDEGHCFRTQALALCTHVHAREVAFRATSLATLTQMVSAGLGLTLLPQSAVAVENRRGQLAIRPLTAPVPHRTLALIWRPHAPFAEAFRSLGKTIAKAAAQPLRP